jgi:hypothetical protein
MFLYIGKESKKPGARNHLLLRHDLRRGRKDTTVGLSGARPGSPRVRNRAFAIDMVETGFVALAPDFLRDGERLPPSARSYDTTDLYARFPDWSCAGKDIWDTMGAVDYLETLSFVNPGRVGMVGHSYGGHTLVYCGAGAAAQSCFCERAGEQFSRAWNALGCAEVRREQPVGTRPAVIRFGSHAAYSGRILRMDGPDCAATRSDYASRGRASAARGRKPRGCARGLSGPWRQ